MKQILTEALGRFEGEGVWRDEAGESHGTSGTQEAVTVVSRYDSETARP